MLTAIKSDLFLLRGQLRSQLLVFAFMIIMSFMQDSNTFVFFYAAFICVFTPFTLASLTEQSGWEAVLLSAPVSRSHMVRARYAVSLGFICVITIISFAVATLMERNVENIYIMLVYLPVNLLLIGLLLPLIYKFGVQKARYFLMGMSMLPAAIMIFMGGTSMVQNSFDMEIAERIFTSISFLLTINAVCVFLLALSCALSCYIYSKKEFS